MDFAIFVNSLPNYSTLLLRSSHLSIKEDKCAEAINSKSGYTCIGSVS